ncbi:hypothetical protein LTR97_003014 [Elasticomyces elasticus]|uniref:FAD-binding domain-containing protein n=1 Tax=Elasticomyces elasticus TaxID=574655 RepID=A0AAN7W9A5_9PEZI|nr:hypothetical protein LTR97_003014 [Elasticomyces elasticus]
MRVVIIGAGVSGLSLYLWLDKLGLTKAHDITIYERRPDVSLDDGSEISIVGGSIGITANGMRVIRTLDEQLFAEVVQAGHRINSWRISTARGWTLADAPTGGPGEDSVMIGREDFCRCFRKRVPEFVTKVKKVLDVEIGSTVNVLKFDDGSSAEADLVVGADGIWSILRRIMFGVQSDAKDYQYAPHYEGLVGVGSYVPANLMQEVPQGQMNIVLGRNGFFGYGIDRGESATSKVARGVCWSTYTLDVLPEDWRKLDCDQAQQQLRARHQHWKNDVIRRIIKEVKIDQVWPTFTTPLLPSWERQGCVLMGDAAHAVQPSSGQGTSMALEDAETLARLLAHHLAEDPKIGHLLACKQYSDLRMPRLAKVHKKAQQLGSMKQDMGVVQEMVMYAFVWALAKCGWGKSYNEYVFRYDVGTEVEHAINTGRKQEQLHLAHEDF